MSKSQKRRPSSGSASPSEVVAAKKRRVFSPAEKLRIIRDAAACGPGEQAALLRREGIYSSHLTTWRRQLETHGTVGVFAIKRGRKPKLDDKDRKIALLEKQLRAAEKELEIRQALIEFQKKSLGAPRDQPPGTGGSLMTALSSLSSAVPLRRACESVGFSRATFYRRRAPATKPRAKRGSR